MPELGSLFGPLGVRDSVLWVVVLVVVAFMALSVAFAGYTFLLRAGHHLRERRWARLSAAWEGPVLRALADADQVSAAHAAVEPRDRLHFVRFLLEYARRVTGEEREVLRRLADPYLEPLVGRAHHRHSEVRTRAVQTLGMLGLPRYADAVVGALGDESPLVAMVAATALAAHGDPGHAEAILGRLSHFRSWSPSFLASMLSGMGADGAPALRRTLENPEEPPWVRSVAARALMELPDFESAAPAAKIASEGEDPGLLIAALELLAVVGRPSDAHAVRALSASTHEEVRAAAFRAMGTLGLEEDVPRLVDALSDPSPWVAISAARGLYAAGGAGILGEVRDSDHPRALLASQILMEQGS